MRIWLAHLALLALLLAAQWLLPSYHVTNLARIMVLALFAIGYNLAFGYTGLLSLGHALFFAAGMYGAGLPVWHWGWTAAPALLTGCLAGAGMAAAVGLLALRSQGVAFMIVTLMFAQAGFLTLIYFAPATGGDDGFALPRAGRMLWGFDLSQDGPRFMLAWALFGLGLLACLGLVQARFGRVLLALRENEERSRMLGYNPYGRKLAVLTISGLYAGAAGAAYALLFGYVGASFAQTQYSILPMLYTLTGGAGTVAGPLIGAGVIFYLSDWASSLTSAWAFVLGAALVILVLFAPRGLLGWLREKFWRELP